MFASKDTLFTRPSGYNISRSVRLRSSASAYFSRTPAGAGSQTTWTWSGWVKRGLLGGTYNLMQAETASTTYTVLQFSSDSIIFDVRNGGAVVGNKYTSAVYRDPSAWYHIVLVWDTTNATASDRMRVYVNGTRVTSFGTSNDPASSAVSYGINGAVAHRIGAGISFANYFDGYLTEINFIDGQALTPSSFGQNDPITGVWGPKKYAGTYGTNGFYLNFSDNSSNTSTTIGKDYSGNGNNWTPNNISVTSGVTYDSMTDVPTLTSATAANYAVANPLAGVTSGRTVTNGNLQIATSASKATIPSSIAISSGKWYWEVTCGTTNNLAVYEFGIVSTSVNITESLDSMTGGSYCYYGYNGNKYSNTTGSAYGATFTNGDVIGVAFDATNGTLTFYKNNTSQGQAFSGLSGEFYPAFCSGSTGSNINFSVNFGQQPFAYTPPSGYVALNTYNLPASTISNGATVMAASLYTGTGSSQTVANTVNSVNFKPDLVWIKSRSAATDHKLTDSVRGTTKALISDTTGAETTDANGLTAFGTTGFTVGTDTVYNNNTATYVAWQWQAGQGTTSSNTSGSITSTVSVNATAGFSIVTYTGTGANATVGHGLGVAPSMVITKPRSNGTDGWAVYHASIGNGGALYLESTVATQSSGIYWNSTTPTSSVFSIGTANRTNGSAYSMVAYCWSAVKGFSAFGSYTGNGSADGPFVYTGFRPRFVLLKRTDNVGNWNMFDSSRNGYNQTNPLLFANTSDAEYTTAGAFEYDILSNGFKVRNTGTGVNANGATVVYACFAENPFKNALAR